MLFAVDGLFPAYFVPIVPGISAKCLVALIMKSIVDGKTPISNSAKDRLLQKMYKIKASSDVAAEERLEAFAQSDHMHRFAQ
ncbi:MAG: hypothetical protein Q4D92_04520 [Slackia sp.]|nr:hypothetical protein [Slackia sp.]